MKIKQLFTLAIAVGISATSVAETAYSTLISNTAKLTYKVNDVVQVPDEDKAEFVVDRYVRFTLTPAVTVLPDAQKLDVPQLITYTLRNDSNAELAFKFAYLDSTNTDSTYSPIAEDNTPTSTGIVYNVYQDDAGGLGSEITTATAIKIAPSTELIVHVRALPTQAIDADIFVHQLTATAFDKDGTTALINNKDAEWTPGIVQTVLENDSDFRMAKGAIKVKAATVSIAKTATIISNPSALGITDPLNYKAVPKATVLYSIILTNEGTEPATELVVTDILPIEITITDIVSSSYTVKTTTGLESSITVIPKSENIDGETRVTLTFPGYNIPAASKDSPETITITFKVILP